MPKLEPQVAKCQSSGWIIHVYDQSRRLRCSLEPSHAWSFVVGLSLGLITSIAGYNLVPSSETTISPVSPTTAPANAIPLGID